MIMERRNWVYLHIPLFLAAFCTVTHFVSSVPLPQGNGTEVVTDIVEITTVNVSDTSEGTQPLPQYEPNHPKVSTDLPIPTVKIANPAGSNNGSVPSVNPGNDSSTVTVPLTSETSSDGTGEIKSLSAVVTSKMSTPSTEGATPSTEGATPSTKGATQSTEVVTSHIATTTLPTNPPTTTTPTSPVVPTTLSFVPRTSETASTQPSFVISTQSTSSLPSTLQTTSKSPTSPGETTSVITPSVGKSTNIPDTHTTKESGDWSIIGITGNSFTGKILLPIAVGTAFSVIIIAVAYCYCSRRGTRYTRVGKTSRNGVHQMTSNDRVMLLADSSEDEF